MIDDGSFVARSSAAVALKAAGVVDVAALVAPPIVRTGHIPPPACLWPTHCRLLLRLRLRIVAALATIAEVKVQKGALSTVPLAVEAHGWVAGGTVSGPRTRPLPLLFVFLLLRPPVSVEHDGLQVAELRLDDP
jgi:hypothetical protein